MEVAETDDSETALGTRRHGRRPGESPESSVPRDRRLVSTASGEDSAVVSCGGPYAAEGPNPRCDRCSDDECDDDDDDGRGYINEHGHGRDLSGYDNEGPDSDPSLEHLPRLPPEMVQYVIDLLPLHAWLTVSKATNEMMRRSPGASLREAMSVLAREGHAGKWQPRSPYKRALVGALADVLDIGLASRVPHVEAMFWRAYRYLSDHDDQDLRANRHVVRVIASEALGLAARFDLAQTLFASLDSGIPMMHPISVSVEWPPERRASPTDPQPLEYHDVPRLDIASGGPRSKRKRTFFFGDARGVFRWLASGHPPVKCNEAYDGGKEVVNDGDHGGTSSVATDTVAFAVTADSASTSTSTASTSSSASSSTSASAYASASSYRWTTKADVRAFARGLLRGGWDAYHMAWVGLVVSVFSEVSDRFGSELGLRAVAREQSPDRLRSVVERVADTLSEIPPIGWAIEHPYRAVRKMGQSAAASGSREKVDAVRRVLADVGMFDRRSHSVLGVGVRSGGYPDGRAGAASVVPPAPYAMVYDTEGTSHTYELDADYMIGSLEAASRYDHLQLFCDLAGEALAVADAYAAAKETEAVVDDRDEEEARTSEAAGAGPSGLRYGRRRPPSSPHRTCGLYASVMSHVLCRAIREFAAGGRVSRFEGSAAAAAAAAAAGVAADSTHEKCVCRRGKGEEGSPGEPGGNPKAERSRRPGGGGWTDALDIACALCERWSCGPMATCCGVLSCLEWSAYSECSALTAERYFHRPTRENVAALGAVLDRLFAMYGADAVSRCVSACRNAACARAWLLRARGWGSGDESYVAGMVIDLSEAKGADASIQLSPAPPLRSLYSPEDALREIALSDACADIEFACALVSTCHDMPTGWWEGLIDALVELYSRAEALDPRGGAAGCAIKMRAPRQLFPPEVSEAPMCRPIGCSYCRRAMYESGSDSDSDPSCGSERGMGSDPYGGKTENDGGGSCDGGGVTRKRLPSRWQDDPAVRYGFGRVGGNLLTGTTTGGRAFPFPRAWRHMGDIHDEGAFSGDSESDYDESLPDSP